MKVKTYFLRLLLLMAFVVPWVTQAQTQTTLTVADGTTTNDYVPVYGLYADAYLRAQIVYPASMMAELTGGEISQMTFYSSTSSASWGSANFEVKLGAATSSTLGSNWDAATLTTVYTGSLSISGGEMTVTFSTPYVYTGGDLLVEVSNLAEGTWVSCTWLGVNQSGASIQGYESYGWSYIDPSAQDFIPKTTFTYISAPVSCPKPATLVYSNLTTTSVDLAWTAGGSETSWAVSVSDGNTTNDYVAYSTSYSLSTLNPATDYTVSVRAICGVGDTSFAKTVSFSTPCAVVTIDATHRIVAGFESGLPNCWTPITMNTANNESASNGFGVRSDYAFSGSYCFRFSSFSLASDYNQYLISPELSSSSGMMVSFMYKCYGTSDNLWVSYSTTGNSIADFGTWIPLDNTTSWTEYSATLPANTKYVAIHYYGEYSYYCWVDDITIEKVPTCFKPTDLFVNNLMQTGATVNWAAPVSGDTPTGYMIAWGTGTDPDAMTNTATVSGSTTNYAITGLDPNTDYNVFVKSVCSATDESSWSAMASFHTLCGYLTTLPYIYGFEGAAIGSSSSPVFDAECWMRLNNGTQYMGIPYISSYDYYCHTGSRGLYWYHDDTYSTYGDYQCLVLPGVDATVYSVNTLRLKFWAKASYHPVFQVGVMTDPSDINTFQSVDTVNVEGEDWKEYKANLNDYTGTGNFVAIKAERPSSSWYAYVDDFTLQAVTCFEPTAVEANDVTSNSAVISWTAPANAPASYILAYGTGDNPDEMTPITVSGTSYSLSGLDDYTTYHVYVKSVCSSTDLSDWTEACTFTTQRVCPNVTNVEAENVSVVGATITWSKSTDAQYAPTYYNLTCRKASNDTLVISTQVSDTTYTLSDLDAVTEYHVTVEPVCGTHGTGDSASVNFTTNSLGCAEMTNILHATVGMGTSPNANLPSHSWYKYSYSQQIYLAADLGNHSAVEIDTISIQLGNMPSDRDWDIYLTNTNSTSLSSGFIPVSNSDLVWSGSTSNMTANDWNEIVLTKAFNYAGGNILVSINDRTGSCYSGNRGICSSGAFGISRYAYNDDNPYNPEGSITGDDIYSSSNRLNMKFYGGECTRHLQCAAPSASVSNVDDHNITVSWNPGYHETAWKVEHRLVGDTAWTVDVASTTNRNYTISGLNNITEYQVRITSLCDQDPQSVVLNATTACGNFELPFSENFAYDLNSCWDKDGVWGTTNYGFNGKHYKMNVWSSNAGAMVTPSLHIVDTVELSFDVAATAYNSNGAPASFGTDDRFVVYAITDNDTTEVAKWDANTAEPISAIPNTGMRVSLPVADYAGQNVRFAFYGESTVSNADWDLHIGNIEVLPLHTYNVEAIAPYTWMNDTTYSYVVNTAAQPDSIVNTSYMEVANNQNMAKHVLHLTMHPAYQLTIDMNICQPDSVELFGNYFKTDTNYTASGLTALYGADSTVTLRLDVHPAPAAAIYYNGEATELISGYCDNADLTLTARSNATNATFAWEDASTAAVRTVNPHESDTFTVVATEATYGCTSLPASVTVSTTPVADLTITATDSVVCAGEPTTLTVADNSGLDVTYRWNTGATTASITVNPTEATTYSVTATVTATGCTTTAEYTVGVNPLPVVAVSTSDDEICLNDAITLNATNVEGYTYMWNNNAALTAASQEFIPAAAGTFTYTVNVTDANGCVNNFTTNSVIVHPSYEMNDEKSACIGMLPYTWGTQSLEVAGSYDQTFTIAYGCDSLVHLNFIVEDIAVNNYYQEVCEGANIIFGEGQYQMNFAAAQTIDTSYLDTTSDVCSARHTLHLTVNHPATNSFAENVCDTYTWNGVEYTETGVYDQTLTTTKGCDSTVTLTLTVRKSTTGVDVQDVCDQLVWKDGNTYTEPNNTATFDTVNMAGCDSVITLNLTTVRTKSYGVDDYLWCESNSFTWMNGRTYTMNETEGNITYLLPVQNAAGCDSLAVLNLVFNLPADTLNWKDTVACDEFIIDTVACDNTVNTAYIRESGDYQLRIHGDNGGDVIARYHLTVQQSSYHTTPETACLPYTWFVGDNKIATITAEMVNGAAVYNMSVNMAELGFVASSCSNIEVLRLTPLYPTYDTTDTVVICDDSSWTDPNGTVFTTTGVHTWDSTGSNPAGCKIYKQVDLTVNPTYNGSVDLVLCESQFVKDTLTNEYTYTYHAENGSDNQVVLYILGPLNGQPYSKSVKTTWTASTGCDSVMTFNYTVNPILRDTTEVATCYKYTWEANGVTYDHDTTVSVLDTSAQYGCDSITTLVLTINDTLRTYIDSNVCTKFEYNGVEYFESMTVLDKELLAASRCDSLVYINFNVHQPTLTEQFVYTNKPYTWRADGRTYTESVSEAYYNINNGGCDSTLLLHLTMGESINICEGQLPYTVQIGNTSFVLDTDAVSGEWTNEDALGNDTIIAYTVNANVTKVIEAFACDSYEWHDSVYTASTDSAHFDTVNVNGCDSTTVLHLTVGTTVNDTITVCDSYTWSINEETYFQSTDVTYRTAGTTSCDSILHLTIDSTVYQSADSLVNAASTIYRGVLYTAPFNGIINDTVKLGAANGCDSITRMHLHVNLGEIITDEVVYCGDYTWRDGNTYTWIPVSERVNPVINYKNRTTGQYVSEFPVYDSLDENGIVINTYVLHLTLQESHNEYVVDTVPLSNLVYNDTVRNYTFGFGFGEEVGHDSTVYNEHRTDSEDSYCSDIVYYTIYVRHNYVNDTVNYCYEADTYITQNGKVVNLAVGVNNLTDTTNAGTADAMVHNMVIVRADAISGSETIVACDSYSWNGKVYTATGIYKDTIAAANGCDSVVTLNITITPTIHEVTTVTACDSYEWNDRTYTASIVDTFAYANTTDTQCVNVDTLKLTVNYKTTGTDSLVVCDSLKWIDGNTYTTSDTASFTLTNAAECDSVVTLNLTVNHSFTGAGRDIDTLATSITLTDKNGPHLYTAGTDENITLVYQTVAGCDSTVTFHLKVSQYQIIADNEVACGVFYWNQNNHYYKWISNEEKTEHTVNISGISPMVPLYKDITSGNYVYSNPTDTVAESVHMLNLFLDEAQFVDSTIAYYPQSMSPLTLHGNAFDLSGLTSATRKAADTVVYLTLPHATLCGTVMAYNVHVVYNYSTDDTTMCYATSYTWEDSTTSDVTVGTNAFREKILFEGDTLNEWVVTRTINVRANNNEASLILPVCDSIVWNGETYTEGGEYTYTTTDQFGCDSTITLNLTVNPTVRIDDPQIACDSLLWHDKWYYASGDYNDTARAAANGCDIITTLQLTVNVNNSGVNDTVSACNEYTWEVSGITYDASGVYTFGTADDNGCNANNTLTLTVNHTVSRDLYVTDGSYSYVEQNGTAHMILSGDDPQSFIERYPYPAVADRCDSIFEIIIHVGVGDFAVDDITACNSFTWRDGNTYVWISADERAAHNNALYKNQTTDAYVTSNPIWRVANEGDYDSIYMLRLNLTQNFVQDFNIDFPISLGTLVYGDSTFNFTMSNDEARVFGNATVDKEVHFHSDYYCDSVLYLHINLRNNYSMVADTDICVTNTTFEWRDSTYNVATEDYDHARIFYLYDTVGTAENPVVEYIKITQHPVVYATERRTACDSYTWNDSTYIKSTSNAIYTTTNQFGCDSIVTLLLTIKKSTDSVETATACGSYEWSGRTFTESIDDTTRNLINSVGCDSTAILHLTVNPVYNIVAFDTVCDSYNWNGKLLTKTGSYKDTLESVNGCDSVVTLNLMVKYNTGHADTATACDSYTWHDTIPYTVSDDYYYEYTAANGCASIDTLHLTVKHSSHEAIIETVCDNYTWHDSLTYTESGDYEFHYTNADGCASTDTLHLTIKQSSHVVTTDTACNSYTWSRNNESYDETGKYVYNYTAENGCASADTLNLIVNHGTHYAHVDTSHCGPFTWVVNNDTVFTYSSDIETSTQFVSPVTKCDSVVYLRLTVRDTYATYVADSLCATELPYVWNVDDDTLLITESGDFSFKYTAENGCDSSSYMNFYVIPTLYSVLDVQVCLGKGYNDNGFVIEADSLPEPGIYTFYDTLTSSLGCDSIVTLNITVGSLLSYVEEQTVCDSYTWDKDDQNRVFTESGTYWNTPYMNEDGCMSIDTLKLIVNHNSNTGYVVSACVSYEWHDSTYTEPGDYEYDYTTEEGCASTDTLHLSIKVPTNQGYTVEACDSYLWNGQTFTEPGDFIFDYISTTGCPSVDTLHLTLKHSSNSAVTETACDSLSWNGNTYTASDDYTYTTTNAAGCDSVVTLHLTVNYSNLTATETQTACESFVWNGQTYTQGGTYTFANQTVRGCDSLTTLTLTVNYGTHNVTFDTNCGSYTWNGQTYATSGNYTYNYTNANGCASTDTLHLTVNSSTTATETFTACDSYTWHGNTYTTSGTQTYTTTNANGCDSIITLHLTINHSTSGIDVQTACDSYTWRDGVTYTASTNTPTFTLQNAAGCDSVITLHLTVNHSTTGTVTQSACDSYTWNGQTYTTSGNYTYSTTNAAGCDSTATLILTINHSVQTTETVTANGPYTWNGNVYTATGTYTYTGTTAAGCDSIATLNLTFTPFVITAVANDNTLGTVTGGGSYNANATVTLTATPAANARFVAWNDGDTNATRVITVTGNATYIANFAYLPVNVTLVVSDATMGTTNPAPGAYTYEVGVPVMAQAVPAAGHLFSNWTVSINGEATTVATNPISVTIPAAYAGASLVVTANFVPDTFDVTVLSNSDVMGTVTGSGRYVYGENATITAMANSGYEFLGWNDGDTNATRTVLVTGDVTYTAMFGLDMDATLTVSVNNADWGYVLINGERSDTYVGQIGDEVTVEAYANEGYRFVNWDDQSTSFSRTVVLTENVMSMIANFEVETIGIDEVEDETVIIYAESNRIIVRGAENKTVRVFDVVGRLVAQRTAAGVEEVFNMPNTGIYLIKVDNAPARRVVVRP